MKIRQYYYTSSLQGYTGRAGFQVKATSPGLSPALQSMLARLIDYQIPAHLAPDALETHPVALRYTCTASGEGILLCSQSIGKDEYGRPGNFFAHALVLDTSTFADTPPVFFWKSPFWRTSDPEEREALASLPVLSCFEGEPGLCMEDIWNFLAQGRRRAWLQTLLCAVIQSDKSRRQLILLDTDEHVALWIAALSCLLPPAYRPLLTFATYHHDADRAPYLVTGTATQSALHPFEVDSPSYFLLDATTGKCSAAEPSPYAELAVQAAFPDLYEGRLLPLFALSERRLPRPVAIDEQLDLLALYARLRDCRPGQERSPGAQQALRMVLPSFAALSQLGQEDIDELIWIERTVRASIRQSAQADSHTTYQQILSLLSGQHEVLHAIVLEELKHFTEQSLLWQPQAGGAMALSMVRQFYGESRLAEVVSGPDYFQWAAHHPSREVPHFILNFWYLLVCTGGTTTPELISQVQRVLANLSAEEYSTLLERCLPEFLLWNGSSDAHLHLVQALFPRPGQLLITEHFWRIYLRSFGALLEQPSITEKAVKLLDFWFELAPHALPEGYPWQQFFLLLSTCEFVQRETFASGVPAERLRSRPWYASIQVTLATRRALLSSPGHVVMHYLQKRLSTRRYGQACNGRELDVEMSRLFEGDDVSERHSQVARLYAEVSAEQFWASYWKHFIRLLTTGEGEKALAACSFWFERAYDVLDLSSTFLSQGFFLGLSSAWSRASGEKGFHTTVQDMSRLVQQKETGSSGELYPWFPLLMSLTGGSTS